MSEYGEVGTSGYPYGVALYKYLEDNGETNVDPLIGGWIVVSGNRLSFTDWTRPTPQPTLAQLESTYSTTDCQVWTTKRDLNSSLIRRDEELGRFGTKMVATILTIKLARAPTPQEISDYINT